MLAGDATNPVAPSMTHGAFDEGVRAAEWALNEVGARRVAVLGAGFAGLGAAHHLADRDVEVVVLEARDRVGGRAHSVDVAGVRADAGAAWLQQGPTNTLARLAEQWSIPTIATDFHSPLAAAPDGAVGEVAAALELLASEAAAAPWEASLADVVPAHLSRLAPPARRAAQQAIDLDIDLENGAPHDRLSAHGVFAEPGVGVADRWLPAGYEQLLVRLAAGLDIRLGSAAAAVEWNEHGVRVVQAGGSDLLADCCICTIPAWLVPELALRPGLPDAHLDALAHLTVGTVEKVILRFSDRWWPVSPSGYLRWYDVPSSWGEWLDLTDGVGSPTVAGLIAGDAVHRRHRGRTDDEVAADATSALAAWSAAVRAGR